MTIEVLESTAGPGAARARVVRFCGEPLPFGLGPGMLGRVFDGVGQVDRRRPAGGRARRACASRACRSTRRARALPRDFIETGIIDAST